MMTCQRFAQFFHRLKPLINRISTAFPQAVFGVILVGLCWDPVFLGCEGNPETVVAYRLMSSALLPVWSVCPVCCDESCTSICDQPCPVYLHTPEVVAESVAPAAGDPTARVCGSWLPPDPPPGAVELVRVEAVDEAGNVSSACLP